MLLEWRQSTAVKALFASLALQTEEPIMQVLVPFSLVVQYSRTNRSMVKVHWIGDVKIFNAVQVVIMKIYPYDTERCIFTKCMNDCQ